MSARQIDLHLTLQCKEFRLSCSTSPYRSQGKHLQYCNVLCYLSLFSNLKGQLIKNSKLNCFCQKFECHVLPCEQFEVYSSFRVRTRTKLEERKSPDCKGWELWRDHDQTGDWEQWRWFTWVRSRYPGHHGCWNVNSFDSNVFMSALDYIKSLYCTYIKH